MKRLLLLAFVACASTPAPRPSPPLVTPAPIAGSPIAIPGDQRAESGVAPFEISMDEHQICVRDAGAVHCGGGDKPLLQEPPLGGISNAISVSTRGDVVCLVTRTGTVHCRGSNTNGELGARLRTERSEELVRVIGIDDATRVSVGEGHVCVLRANGTVACWGRNESGQTASDTSHRPEARELVEPTPVPSLNAVVGFAAGGGSSCAVTARRETWCWGQALSAAQELANGRANEALFCHAALDGMRDITASAHGMCGTKENDVFCWGGDRSLQQHEIKKIAVKNVRLVRSGQHHSCALTHDGAVFCWGTNMQGELGRGADADDHKSWEPHEPGPVPNLPPAHDLAVGGSMSCAITGRSQAMCWGGWRYGDRGWQTAFSPLKLSL